MRTIQQIAYPELNAAPLPVTSQQSNAAGLFSYDGEIKEFMRLCFGLAKQPLPPSSLLLCSFDPL